MSARDVDPLRLQALYYVATGVWPIVHLRSFYAVTGAKRDGWLVQTFGALVVALGTVMWPRRTGAARHMQEQLATASAVALIASEIVFTTRRRISPIYLADAALEATLALAIVARRSETKLPQR
jgi:hypothetical protein